VNLLAFIVGVICLVVAVVHAVPVIVVGLAVRALSRRVGLPPMLLAAVATRLRWAPVLAWGAAALLCFVLAFAA
jgi:hypothetical protein